jgi:hypothetical protein
VQVREPETKCVSGFATHTHEQQMSKREGCPGLGIWVW